MPPPIDTSPPTAFLSRLAHAQAELDAGFAHLPPTPAPALDDHAAAILAEAAERAARQRPLRAPPLRRPDAEAAAPHRPRRLRPGHVGQPQQPRPRRRPRQLRHGTRSRRRARRKMFGWPQHLGHLTSSGTFANLEALWVAGQLHPGPRHRRIRPGPLHPHPHLRRARPSLRADPHRLHRPHGPRRPRRRARRPRPSAPSS